MSKNTLGQFIAALRKANGMTQQEVADRLNISNKAVSRWERDECSPDISLLPAIAEMFGVTCDELLRGERSGCVSAAESDSRKTEKQVRALIGRTVSGIRTMAYISITVSVIGLVCMFGISYGFYRPVIGFSIMLLFEICACAITVLGITKAKDIKENELFCRASESQSEEFRKTLGNGSFASFFSTFSVVLLSLPLILTASSNPQSVLTFQSYFESFFLVVVFILVFVFFRFRKAFCDWITENRKPEFRLVLPKEKTAVMNTVQILLTVLAGILFVVAPYFEIKPHNDILSIVVAVLGILCLAASIVLFTVFFFRRKDERPEFTLTGIRNLLLIPSAFIASECHYTGWTYYEAGEVMANPEKYDIWHAEYLLYAVGYAFTVIMIFSLIKMKKRTNGNRSR